MLNLVFKTVSASTIYDPEQLTSGTPLTIRIYNEGTNDIENLGIYLAPSTTLGDVDYPADYPPETDYQDLLTWGEDTVNTVTPSGGLKITLPQNTGPDLTNYFTRTQGNTAATKLVMANIPASDYIEITLELETPPSISARRVYINLRLDNGI